MDSSNPYLDSDGTKIPPTFYSFLEEGPFKNCVVCETFLLRSGVQYFIEKSYKRNEVIFEYAICLNCAMKFRNAYSEESKAFIENYFSEHVNFIGRGQELLKTKDKKIEDWLSNCLFTNTRREALEDYHIYAQCNGKELLLSYLPFLIHSKVIEEMSRGLSQKTKDENDRFVSDHLNKMPDFDSILNGPKMVLV